MSQVNESFVAKDSGIAEYLKLVLDLILYFEKFELVKIPRLKNAHADALSKLPSSKDSMLLNIVPIKHLLMPSITKGEKVM